MGPAFFETAAVGRGLQSARFYNTVVKLGRLPDLIVPEVAFAGRSNAGKSTAINKLCGRNRLAFASKTPGRTQALNYFAIGPDDSVEGFVVDTPGYGYAQAPEAVRQSWRPLAAEYLRTRDSLVGLVLVLDCRREITERDADLLAWVPAHVPRLLLVTKTDKLGRAAQQQTFGRIQQQYQELMPDIAASIIMFSATSGAGLEATRRLIEEWFHAGAAP